MSLDGETNAVYEAGATTFAARTGRPDPERPAALAAVASDGPILDLGCGPGWHLPLLGPAAIGLDPARAMLAEARSTTRATHPLVQGHAGALPVRPRSLGGVWASRSLQHIDAVRLPRALAELHRALPVGAPLAATLFAGEGSGVSGDESDLPGRRFTFWEPAHLMSLVEGAGFEDISCDPPPDSLRSPDSPQERWAQIHLTTRARSLPDTVGPGMRLLVCGLNPSLHAADAGVGYAGPGNRFWPALVAAGLCDEGSVADPWRLLDRGDIGMTDLVKRATPRAAELTTAEHRAGLVRLERLCTVLAPEAVIVVGLAGWRAAIDRRAQPGWQRRRLGPSPVYLMPSTSGLNAATSLATLVDHLRAVTDPPPRP